MDLNQLNQQMQAQTAQQQAVNLLITNTAIQIYAGCVDILCTPEDLRRHAQFACKAAPYLAEAMGIIKVTEANEVTEANDT